MVSVDAILRSSPPFIIIILSLSIIYPTIILLFIRRITKSQFRNLNYDDKQEIYALTYTKYPEEYYKSLRDEIKREDEITHQRLTWSITFQGFLVNALALLIILSGEMSISNFYIRKLALFAISLIGLHIGFITLIGIKASRNSINTAKKAWEERNAVWRIFPNKAPQAYGQLNSFHGGSFYSEAIPYVFIVMWVAFIAIYIMATYIFEIFPCINSDDIIYCVYTNRISGNYSDTFYFISRILKFQ